MKVKKEDKDSFNEALTMIANLQNIITNVEQKQEESTEKFKKSLNELIPQLDAEINELFEKSKDEKFLKEESLGDMYDMLKQLDAIEEKFNELEATATKYNSW